ncbi:hypothetical protein PCASD_06358 [Puccinia coronata f. sp. avenae]|uniref:Ras-GEF domain-containing protein n=1 Tax=Puccinia coronata f. sp. avenae TaxID=200324 RepID=A0A2N5UX78_9BASI|nr:hypothetical protein PCASD_06358 [Puccinia coronata f. sp. avenae]
MNDGKLIVISIVGLLHTCFQDCSPQPLIPGREHALINSWPQYLLDDPDPPPHYTYDEMALRSGPDSPKFSYTDIPQLHGYQPASSSHGFAPDRFNAYHHPSSSSTFSDHHSDLPSDHNVGVQHWNPRSGPGPIVQQQPIYDVSIPDVHFAWISTLFFPGQRRLDRLLKDDWGLKQIRRIDFGLRNVAGLNENVSTANRNLELLLEEIDKRNKQFFMCFTPVPAEGKNFLTELKKETTYQDMKNENAILLQWFALQIRALSHSDDRHGSSAPPSFHIKLVEHLKTDWSRTELMAPHWQPQLRPSRQNVDKNGILHTTASITSASRTEIAMYALEIYYKLSNSTKWRELFLQDDRFVENLARIPKYTTFSRSSDNTNMRRTHSGLRLLHFFFGKIAAAAKTFSAAGRDPITRNLIQQKNNKESKDEKSPPPSKQSIIEWFDHPLTPPEEQHVPALFDGTAHLVERRNCRRAAFCSQYGSQQAPNDLHDPFLLSETAIPFTPSQTTTGIQSSQATAAIPLAQTPQVGQLLAWTNRSQTTSQSMRAATGVPSSQTPTVIPLSQTALGDSSSPPEDRLSDQSNRAQTTLQTTATTIPNQANHPH